MPRRRMIDPKFWGDETIGKLTPDERLFYIGLFSLADDEGRICGSPTYLRSQIYPYDDLPLDSVVAWLKHLDEIELIHTYDDPSGNGSKYIDHPKWFKYQRIDHPTPSLLPPCPKFRTHIRKRKNDSYEIPTKSENESKNDSRIKEVKLSKGKGREGLEEVKRLEEIKRSKDTLVELWNSICVDLPKVKFLSNSREKKIRDRLKEHPQIEFWIEVFEKCQNTPFLRGENKSGWKVTFNWLFLNDNNALKVIEGNYEKEKFAGIKQWLSEMEASTDDQERL